MVVITVAIGASGAVTPRNGPSAAAWRTAAAVTTASGVPHGRPVAAEQEGPGTFVVGLGALAAPPARRQVQGVQSIN